MDRPNILIVDDRIENIISLETLMAPLEVNIVKAISGNEALEKTLEQDFTLILMDVQMPDMDGYETVRIMRTVRKTRYTPVIFVSAIYSEDYYKIKGVETGAVDFITKPISPALLLGKVKIIIDMQKQKDELQREIDQRRKVEQELESNREHVKLINRILRHDITNNLSVIKSALSLYNKTDNRDMLGNIENMVFKSVNLISRMRELETLLSQDYNLKPFELSKVIGSCKEKYPEVEIKLEGRASVFADETIISVFDNLIANSILHGKSSKIEICIEKGPKFAKISVTDFGTGIPDNIKDRIFDEEFTYGDTGHTGLGLYIVKKSIERYGGHIYVQNNKPSGVIFIMELLYVK